jgi:hypothetical protein
VSRTTLPGAMHLAPDGRIWLLDNYNWRWPGHLFWQVTRLNSDGNEDEMWQPAVFEVMQPVLGPPPFTMLLPDRNLMVACYNAGAVNGSPTRGLCRVLLNAPVARFELDSASASVVESVGRAMLNLIRCGPNTNPVTVVWSTEGGTAKPGVDYVPASGTLTFPAGSISQTIPLDILDNLELDADRTIRLRLHSPAPDQTEYPLVEVTVRNDDIGLLPGAVKRFPNGRVLLRSTGLIWPDVGSALVEASTDLRDWTADDPLGASWISPFRPDFVDTNAPPDNMRFYRLSNIQLY